MKFREKKTGNIIIAKTKAIIESYKKNSLYEIVEEKTKENKASDETKKAEK